MGFLVRRTLNTGDPSSRSWEAWARQVRAGHTSRWLQRFWPVLLALGPWSMLDSGRSSQACGQPPNSPSKEQSLETEILGWIEKLGDGNYAVRLQAQSELVRIGVRALDHLHRASFHPDPQISSQARFLVQSNQFSWAWETDPFQVRRILGNYSAAPLYERSAFIDQLHALDSDEGLPALCRLIRYETQGCLAKRAALLVMRGKPQIGQSLAERKGIIAELLDGAMSVAGRWVLDYATLPDPVTPHPWLDSLEQERVLLGARSPDTSIEVVTDLQRWLVERLAADPSQREQALDIARRISEIIPESNPSTAANPIEFAQWALETRLPELVREQHDRMNDLALLDPRLGYLLAESHALQGNLELASRVADFTLVRTLVDSHGEFRRPDPNARDGTPLNRRLEEMLQRNGSLVFERSAIGNFLIRRGQFPWAEKELRVAIQGHEDDVEFATILNLTQLSQMLHELGRDDEAADVLKKYADRFEREPMFRSQVSAEGGDSLVSNFYLFRGDHARSQGDSAQAREMYRKSIELSEENVDAIIGLYRLEDGDDTQIQERRKIQQQITSHLRQEIDAREREMKRDNPRFQATEQQSLSNQMNTLAWLIANTEGSFEEALYLSRKACAMTPNRSAYLDTLAHCLAALNRYREAVEQQRKAVALEPHQPSLVRALQRFEAKLQEQPKP